MHRGRVAIALVVMVIEGELLLPMRRGIGVIEVEDNGRRGLWVTGEEVLHERLREAIEILPIHAVFQT